VNTDADRKKMLDAIGIDSIDRLFDQIPVQHQFQDQLDIPESIDEINLTKHLAKLASLNADCARFPSFLGGGAYDHYVPPAVGAVLGRSEFYTSYTPYQPEISQGVLQSIYEFQSLVGALLGMDAANASMYDAATGLAEAALMATDITKRKRILLFGPINPSYLKVLDTYLRHKAIDVVQIDSRDGAGSISRLKLKIGSSDAAVIVQNPNFFGNIEDVAEASEIAHKNGALLIEIVDPISLGLLKSPGDYDADIAIGEGQSLGCPIGFGGPLLGLFACKNEYLRRIPGRIVGETKDIEGRRAFVMTLRTREQDIRREKATSNICTNVALHALAACVYLSSMGKNGIRQTAALCAQKAHYAVSQIELIPGFELSYPDQKFFKEFVITTPVPVEAINDALWEAGIIGGHAINENQMLIAVTEMRTKEEIDTMATVFNTISGRLR
jgi:glycine dehydrogenase subunit 1